MDIMFYEFFYIVYGFYDQVFYVLWNQFREELEGLFMKGYIGEGFLFKGYKLGG